MRNQIVTNIVHKIIKEEYSFHKVTIDRGIIAYCCYHPTDELERRKKIAFPVVLQQPTTFVYLGCLRLLGRIAE